MLFYGMSSSLVGEDVSEKVALITNSLENIYTFNLVLVLPVIVILYGSVTKKPIIPMMLVSTVIAMLNAFFIQHFSLHDIVTLHDIVKSAVDGFNISLVQGKDFPAILGNLLNRGGMNSMMNTLLICFCALSFAGTLTLSGAVEVIVNHLLKLVSSTGSMILATIACGLTVIGVTCNGQISILSNRDFERSLYRKRFTC